MSVQSMTKTDTTDVAGTLRQIEQMVEAGCEIVRIAVPDDDAAAALKEGLDTLRGGTLNAEDGMSRFAVRYMVKHHYFDIGKARRDLGYAPRVSLDEGIRLTCEALKRQDLS